MCLKCARTNRVGIRRVPGVFVQMMFRVSVYKSCFMPKRNAPQVLKRLWPYVPRTFRAPFRFTDSVMPPGLRNGQKEILVRISRGRKNIFRWRLLGKSVLDLGRLYLRSSEHRLSKGSKQHPHSFVCSIIPEMLAPKSFFSDLICINFHPICLQFFEPCYPLSLEKLGSIKLDSSCHQPVQENERRSRFERIRPVVFTMAEKQRQIVISSEEQLGTELYTYFSFDAVFRIVFFEKNVLQKCIAKQPR